MPLRPLARSGDEPAATLPAADATPRRSTEAPSDPRFSALLPAGQTLLQSAPASRRFRRENRAAASESEAEPAAHDSANRKPPPSATPPLNCAGDAALCSKPTLLLSMRMPGPESRGR